MFRAGVERPMFVLIFPINCFHVLFSRFLLVCSFWKGELLSRQTGSKHQMESFGGGPCWTPTQFRQDPAPELFVHGWVSVFILSGCVLCFVHVVLFLCFFYSFVCCIFLV